MEMNQPKNPGTDREATLEEQYVFEKLSGRLKPLLTAKALECTIGVPTRFKDFHLRNFEGQKYREETFEEWLARKERENDGQ